MSDTEGMLLFWLATFDQWTMSQFRFPVIKGVVIVSHAFFFFSQGQDLLLSITQKVLSNDD